MQDGEVYRSVRPNLGNANYGGGVEFNDLKAIFDNGNANYGEGWSLMIVGHIW